MNERRRQVAARYGELFVGAGLAAAPSCRRRRRHRRGRSLLPEPAGAAHVFHQYVIRVLPDGARDALRSDLDARGIETQIYYPVPLHLQPCFASLGYQVGDLPTTERLAHEVLALPMHPDLTADEQERVVGEIARLLRVAADAQRRRQRPRRSMSFEGILLWSLGIGAAIGAGLLVVALRGAEPSAIARATALGQLRRGARGRRRARRRASATISWRRRSRPSTAASGTRRAVLARSARCATDPADGEVLVELGLVEAYHGTRRRGRRATARGDRGARRPRPSRSRSIARSRRSPAAIARRRQAVRGGRSAARDQARRRRRVGRAGVRRVVPPRRRAVARRRRHASARIGRSAKRASRRPRVCCPST